MTERTGGPVDTEGASNTERPRSKILLVDDRPDNLMALEAILASLDQDLVTASSGEEALKRLLIDDFAVILLDVQMPGMDGFETAHRIKQRGRTRDTPIIFLTAIDREPHHAFRGYAVGAVDYIAKPFDPWLLRAKVSVFVELFEKNERLAELAHQRVRDFDLITEVAERLIALDVLLDGAATSNEETLAAASAEVRGLVSRLRPFARSTGGQVE
ncbi:MULTISPECIES: two-component system response regulator [Parafrankia]|uniref:Histidine kinase n=1 Tax=Parafrankia soli TaxID=2599596 RepID=A0A1S1RBD9_9ACTN|nr:MULTISPECIES: response regulator [Parafrankia]OHV43089.1 histidine kinase [Parafrankia soli]TCJ35170.1 response regulator [Parafrankia sp. BMG5.11]CAI7976129.1 Response regulator [Frankia sp. Hr75.2]SQD97219.1 Response regulator receiver protein [Parafrankia sp. Ea1.12]